MLVDQDNWYYSSRKLSQEVSKYWKLDSLSSADDGVPDEEAPGVEVLEEHAAVAAVEHIAVTVVGGGRAERRGGDEDRVPPEDAEDGRRPVERAVAGREGGVGEGAAPGLADGRGADEARRVVGREAE